MADVLCVWQRHDLETFPKRLNELDVKVAKAGIILDEVKVIALKRKKEKKEAYGEIETSHPVYLGSQDPYSRVAFAKLYASNHAITSSDILTTACCPSSKSMASRCCAY